MDTVRVLKDLRGLFVVLVAYSTIVVACGENPNNGANVSSPLGTIGLMSSCNNTNDDKPITTFSYNVPQMEGWVGGPSFNLSYTTDGKVVSCEIKAANGDKNLVNDNNPDPEWNSKISVSNICHVTLEYKKELPPTDFLVTAYGINGSSASTRITAKVSYCPYFTYHENDYYPEGADFYIAPKLYAYEKHASDYSFRLGSGSMPAGLTLNTQTGVVSGKVQDISKLTANPFELDISNSKAASVNTYCTANQKIKFNFLKEDSVDIPVEINSNLWPQDELNNIAPFTSWSWKVAFPPTVNRFSVVDYDINFTNPDYEFHVIHNNGDPQNYYDYRIKESRIKSNDGFLNSYDLLDSSGNITTTVLEIQDVGLNLFNLFSADYGDVLFKVVTNKPDISKKTFYNPNNESGNKFSISKLKVFRTSEQIRKNNYVDIAMDEQVDVVLPSEGDYVYLKVKIPALEKHEDICQPNDTTDSAKRKRCLPLPMMVGGMDFQKTTYTWGKILVTVDVDDAAKTAGANFDLVAAYVPVDPGKVYLDSDFPLPQDVATGSTGLFMKKWSDPEFWGNDKADAMLQLPAYYSGLNTELGVSYVYKEIYWLLAVRATRGTGKATVHVTPVVDNFRQIGKTALPSTNRNYIFCLHGGVNSTQHKHHNSDTTVMDKLGGCFYNLNTLNQASKDELIGRVRRELTGIANWWLSLSDQKLPMQGIDFHFNQANGCDLYFVCDWDLPGQQFGQQMTDPGFYEGDDYLYVVQDFTNNNQLWTTGSVEVHEISHQLGMADNYAPGCSQDHHSIMAHYEPSWSTDYNAHKMPDQQCISDPDCKWDEAKRTFLGRCGCYLTNDDGASIKHSASDWEFVYKEPGVYNESDENRLVKFMFLDNFFYPNAEITSNYNAIPKTNTAPHLYDNFERITELTEINIMDQPK